jgi:serine/threonine protein kinase
MNSATFFRHLKTSQLLSPDQVRRTVERFGANPTADIAEALVAEGMLTEYQAEQLLAGKSRGFILGGYRILDYLGQGGTAYVFRGVESATGRVVALKVIKPDILGADVLLSFRSEAQTAAWLRHPNIASAYEIGKSGKAHFLALEYVDGLNLRQVVRKGGPLPVALACDLMRQTAEALAYAHAQGVVHRDLKPANLLIRGLPGWTRAGPPAAGWFALIDGSPVPEVKVLDFGLARLRQAEAESLWLKSGDVYGTPDFLAPEQAWDIHAADIRSDLYSLGCTFYYTLTGKVPFPGATALEKLLRHQVEEPLPLEQRRPDVPSVVAAIVRRLMAKDPADRFQTPAEVVKALQPWGLRQTPNVPMTETTAHAPRTTPVGSNSEAGTGWVLENLVPRPNGARAPRKAACPRTASGWRVRLARKWRPWAILGTGLAFGLGLLALLLWLGWDTFFGRDLAD